MPHPGPHWYQVLLPTPGGMVMLYVKAASSEAIRTSEGFGPEVLIAQVSAQVVSLLGLP